MTTKEFTGALFGVLSVAILVWVAMDLSPALSTGKMIFAVGAAIVSSVAGLIAWFS